MEDPSDAFSTPPPSPHNDKDPPPPPATPAVWKGRAGTDRATQRRDTARATVWSSSSWPWSLRLIGWSCLARASVPSRIRRPSSLLRPFFVPLSRRHASSPPEDANPQAVDLLSKMLVFNPAKRCTIADALRHPWLKGYRDPEVRRESRPHDTTRPDAAPLDRIASTTPYPSPPHTTHDAPELVATRNNSSSFRRGGIARRRHAAARNRSVRDTARRA